MTKAIKENTLILELPLTKPRSMNRVLSDIEYCITNKVSDDIIELDIVQLISQLNNLKNNLFSKKKAYNLINPAIEYYK